MAGQLHHSLATGKECQLLTAAMMGFDDGSQERTGFFCLAGQLIRQQNGLIAQLPAGIARCNAEFSNRTVDHSGHIVQFLGGFHRKK